MLRTMQRSQQFTTIFQIVMVTTVLTACDSFPLETEAESTRIDPAVPNASPSGVVSQIIEKPADTYTDTGGNQQSKPLSSPQTAETEAEIETETETETESEARAEPPASQDLWDRLRAGFVLDHRLSQPRVQSEIRWYQRNPDYLKRVGQRAAPHLHFIVEQIEAAGLPREFALLPIIESAYDPFAYSHGRAAGIWQIIPGTARHLGLKSNYWYDGRRDIPDATDAALRYLAALHRSLDENWLLALAAYNNGEGNVRRAMRRNRQSGKPETFFELKLNSETAAYVPRLLAISAVVSDPEKYGVSLPDIPDRPHWVMVDVGGQIDIANAADLMDVSAETVYRLNPGLNQWSTPPSGPHRLLVPIPKVSRLLSGLQHLPVDQRIAWQRHVVTDRETLSDIALAYGTTVSTLQQSNNIKGHIIVPGQSLMIPTARQPRDAYSHSQSERLKRSQNRLQTIHGKPVRHRVVRGDTLWDLSMKYDVSLRRLAKWNGKAPRDLLLPGEELLLFGIDDAEVTAESPTSTDQADLTQATPRSSAMTPHPQPRNIVRKINYRVRSGESLASIASRFKVTVSRILEWNVHLVDRRYIHPGDPITLYVDVTNAH